MKSYITKLKEDTYNTLKKIKEQEGIPYTVSIQKAVEMYAQSKRLK